MKRIIFLTAFILSFSLLGMSQSSGSDTAIKTRSKTVKTYNTPQFEKIWNLRPEISIGFPLKLDFLFSAGYQINPYVFLGLGAGVGSFRPNIYYPFWYSTSFPLFATCRVNFLTNKFGFTPFFETKMGYSFGLMTANFDYYYTNIKNSGFYGSWGIGHNWHNFDLLFSFNLWSLVVFGDGIGDDLYHKHNEFRCNFSISIAYNIPLKKKSQAHSQPQK